jgi:hypothetical protein
LFLNPLSCFGFSRFDLPEGADHGSFENADAKKQVQQEIDPNERGDPTEPAQWRREKLRRWRV